jgi:hypothetical protein
MPALAVACIGRRDLKLSEKCYLESVGALLAERGFTVCSGNAPGSDQAYAHGANLVDGRRVELYLPWATFERKWVDKHNTVWLASQAWPKHVELAASASPGWDRGVRETVKPLMIRNAMIIFRWGQPVDRVLAYPDCTKHGWSGTGHAMRVAATLGVPVWLVNKGRFWEPTEGMPQEKP